MIVKSLTETYVLCLQDEMALHNEKRKENTMAFGINLMRSPVLYQAAQGEKHDFLLPLLNFEFVQGYTDLAATHACNYATDSDSDCKNSAVSCCKGAMSAACVAAFYTVL